MGGVESEGIGNREAHGEVLSNGNQLKRLPDYRTIVPIIQGEYIRKGRGRVIGDE